MDLASLARPELVFPALPGTDRATVIQALAERLAAQGLVASAEELYQKVWEREQLGTTGIGAGVAIPHCKMKGLPRALLAIGVTSRGIDFAAVDAQPVRLLFLVVSPSESPAEHLQVLAAISRWVKADRHVERLLAVANDRQGIFTLLQEPSA